MNSPPKTWRVRQHNDRILDNASVSAAKRWGLKPKNKKPEISPCGRDDKQGF